LVRPGSGDDIVRRIKDSLDIVDVIGSYIELKKRGASYLALCPFHSEKTPSFNVNQLGQFFHCFGCKKSGDVIEFVMAMEGIGFVDALELLGERSGIKFDQARFKRKGDDGSAGRKSRIFKVLEAAAGKFEKNLRGKDGGVARKYLNKRQISPETASGFRIGYSKDGWNDLKGAMLGLDFSEDDLLNAGLIKRSEKGRSYDLFRNRLILPIFDISGRVVGFGGRVLDSSLPKYINSPDSPVFNKRRLFYGLNLARRSFNHKKCAVLVEGYTDVIMASSKGVMNIVATLGTALTQEHATLLKRMVDRVILFFDGDEAGNTAAGRGVEILLKNDLDVLVVPLPEGRDPFDYFSHAGADEFESLVERSGEDFFDFTFRHHGKQHDTATPAGKSKLAGILLKQVSCHRDRIKRDLYMKRAAERLQIDEELLRREYTDLLSGKRSRNREPEVDRKAERSGDIKITTMEDDLVLGLLRDPSQMSGFKDEFAAVITEDKEAAAIFEQMIALHESGQLDVRSLIDALRDLPDAKKRVIALAADPLDTDPAVLVRSALDSLKKKRLLAEYEQIRKMSRDVLKSKGVDEKRRLLKEIDSSLKMQKKNRGVVEEQ